MKLSTWAILVAVFISGCAMSPVQTTVGDVSQQIVGVWMFDNLVSTTTHIASRSHYFPDGSFVSDYRISHPGSSLCFRETGRWSFEGDLFIEESTSTTHPNGRKTPKLLRKIESASPTELHLISRTGMKALLKRGPRLRSKGFRLTEDDLLADLEAMHMRGFIPFPIPGRPHEVGWRVECTTIESMKR